MEQKVSTKYVIRQNDVIGMCNFFRILGTTRGSQKKIFWMSD